MMKKLAMFEQQCRWWRERRDSVHNYPARQTVYLALAQRHGVDALKRHQHLVRNVLDRAEQRAVESGGAR